MVSALPLAFFAILMDTWLELDLPKGKTTLETYLYNQKDEMGGAYFTEVELL